MYALWATQAFYRALWMLIGGILVWLVAELARHSGRDVGKWVLICVGVGVCTFGLGSLFVLGWLSLAKAKNNVAT